MIDRIGAERHPLKLPITMPGAFLGRTSCAERGLRELYTDDVERADRLILGRRGVLQGASLATLAAVTAQPFPSAASCPAATSRSRRPGRQAQFSRQVAWTRDVLGDKPPGGNAGLPARRCRHPDRQTLHSEQWPDPDPPANADIWELVVDGEVNAPRKITWASRSNAFRSDLSTDAGVWRQRPRPVRLRGARQPVDHGRRRLLQGGPASASRMRWRRARSRRPSTRHTWG